MYCKPQLYQEVKTRRGSPVDNKPSTNKGLRPKTIVTNAWNSYEENSPGIKTFKTFSLNGDFY